MIVPTFPGSASNAAIIRLGIICVPADYAQDVADELVKGGVHGIWNFANVSLKVPEDVVVQREVIAGGFAVLSVKLERMRRQHENRDPEVE